MNKVFVFVFLALFAIANAAEFLVDAHTEAIDDPLVVKRIENQFLSLEQNLLDKINNRKQKLAQEKNDRVNIINGQNANVVPVLTAWKNGNVTAKNNAVNAQNSLSATQTTARTNDVRAITDAFSSIVNEHDTIDQLRILLHPDTPTDKRTLATLRAAPPTPSDTSKVQIFQNLWWVARFNNVNTKNFADGAAISDISQFSDTSTTYGALWAGSKGYQMTFTGSWSTSSADYISCTGNDNKNNKKATRTFAWIWLPTGVTSVKANVWVDDFAWVQFNPTVTNIATTTAFSYSSGNCSGGQGCSSVATFTGLKPAAWNEVLISQVDTCAGGYQGFQFQ